MIKSLVYTVEGILTVEYEYNYLGDRISKTVDGDRTTYILEYSSGLSQVIEETINSKTVFYVRDLDLISREELGKTYFYVLDGGNTVRDLVDEDGNVTDKYIFDSFGNEISHEGDSNNSYGFQGEKLDEETGLYYLRARYMNSSTGTFTSMDTYGGSLSVPTSLHKYLFANSNPVKYCDSTGHYSLLVELEAYEAIDMMLMGTVMGGLSYFIDMAATDPDRKCHNVGGYFGSCLAGFIITALLLCLPPPLPGFLMAAMGCIGIFNGTLNILDGHVGYGLFQIMYSLYFLYSGLAQVFEELDVGTGSRGGSDGENNSSGGGNGDSGSGNGSSSGGSGDGQPNGNGGNGSSGNTGDGTSSGSPAGEGSGDVPGGDLPSGEGSGGGSGGDLTSGDGPNTGEPSIPGENGGNPSVPDSETGGLPNTEPNLPNSGDNPINPGATNQSGNVGGNGYGSRGVKVDYNGAESSVYRGGNDFTIKPNEVKIDVTTGNVRTTHGVSVDVNPDTVSRFGGAYRIDEIPDGLRIIQRGGRSEHFEIVPSHEMPLSEFQDLLNKIVVTKVC